MKSPLNIVAAGGLILGGLLGLAGTMVTQRNFQAALWGIDGAALVVATSLLALKFFKQGNDVVAAGFLIFAMASSVMLIGTAASLEESAPSFAAHLSELESAYRRKPSVVTVCGECAGIEACFRAGPLPLGEGPRPQDQRVFWTALPLRRVRRCGLVRFFSRACPKNSPSGYV